ncbi:MAG: hypothetical protein PHU46_16375 [Rhodocyclaceae bacterium]|nr:hypothetical protein [Rhodocyclaceae bacterium]
MSAAPFDPGFVRLRLGSKPGHGPSVAIELARPTAVTALRGKPADQAVRLLPLLYSICGAAQGAAARLALDAARGQPHAPATDPAVLLEARREHLWRLLLDWPRALGQPGQETLLAEARRRLGQEGGDTWVAVALNEPLEHLEQALSRLPEPAPVPDIPLLPPLAAAETLALWPRLEADFAAAPTWNGRPALTGPLARHAGARLLQPIAASIRARMSELSHPSGLGRTSSAAIAPGIGRATVETARGLLMHEIALEGDRIGHYVIIAPTEWNFHARGPLVSWLEGTPSPSARRELAPRLVLALDPCVRWQIEDGEGA